MSWDFAHDEMLLKVLQHNVGRSGDALHCLLETAVERGTDLVLIQEPPARLRYAHPEFDLIWTTGRTLEARRKDSEWTFSIEDDLTKESEGDVQAIAVGVRGKAGKVLRIVNAYFQKVGCEGRRRPAGGAQWDELVGKECILAGDFNAHSPVWNPRCVRRREHRFLEDLIDAHELTVLNDGRATRPAEGRGHSVIDLTLDRKSVV